MKNKQIIGIIVAAVMLVFVASAGVLMNEVNSQVTTQKTSFWDAFNEVNDSFTFPMENYIAVVKVEGTIIEGSSSTTLFGSSDSYDHTYTLKYINQLMDQEKNQGILLYVDSPGGSVLASDELYLKLEEYKNKTGKPIYVYMNSMACSGGYYISMAGDYIMSNRNGWTGSIGVITSLMNYKELYDKLGIKEVDITSGANKAMGSGGIDMTQEQKDIFQSLVDEAYDQFVGIVAKGRAMDETIVRTLADGRIYSAQQAQDNKLIDEVVATYDDAVKYVREHVNTAVSFYSPERGQSEWSKLFGMFSKQQETKTDAQVLAEFLQNKGSGVPMYYAKP